MAEVHRDSKGSNTNANHHHVYTHTHTHTRPNKKQFISQIGRTLQILYLATRKHHNYTDFYTTTG